MDAHLIYLGGPFEWQHRRAVETAKVHGPVVVWYAGEPDGDCWTGLRGVEKRPLELPDWLRNHPIQLANVKDLFAWTILRDYGGVYLDLDTISLLPVWDLLTRDVCVSQEWPNLSDGEHPYNSAVVVGRRGAVVLDVLAERARAILEAGESRWGKTGPHLLTEVVAEYPDAFDVAPFGVLSGWRDDTIGDYYAGARPGEDVRVVHLYSSSRPEAFAADCWYPASPANVTAVLVTRGDVDLAPIAASLVFKRVVVYDNSIEDDAGAYGRYAALDWDEVETDVIYTQDDDCIVSAEAQLALLAAYEDGLLVSNMNPDHNAGMPLLALPGWGALFRRDLPAAAFDRWRAAEPEWERSDDFLRIGCDIVFPVLTPSKMVDLGHENQAYAWDENRTHVRPGYGRKKRGYYDRAAALR